MRTRALLPALMAAAIVAPMTPAGAYLPEPGSVALDDAAWGGTGTADTIQVGEITHVANIAYSGGSDVEFSTQEVTKLDGGATGNPVCATGADGSCLVDGDGNIVYETEERDFAFAGVLSQFGRVIDITDPTNPVQVATLPCRFNQNDIQIQGDLVFQAADNGGSQCFRPDGSIQTSTVGISDISDPRNPAFLGGFREGPGAHNVTVHPTAPVAYVSNSDLTPNGNIHIWEFADPAAPTKVMDYMVPVPHSPHDITFNADGSRAYAAAVSTSYILNTVNPKAPELVSIIPNEGISISHQSDPTPDGKFLLIGDELGGGGAPTVSPGGPVHVYDLTVEARPVKIGAFGNDTVNAGATSTSHVFRINPDGYTMAIAWYQDGIGVIDFSHMRGVNAAGLGATSRIQPRVIAWMKMPGADSWSAKMWQERHPGYVFVNDISRGFDVFHVPELGEGFIATGTIVGGHPATKLGGGGSETAHTVACDRTAPSQGLDAHAVPIPDEASDGEHRITVKGDSAGAYDLDLVWYNSSCGWMDAGDVLGTEPDPSGVIPEGTAWAVISAAAGTQIVFNAYVSEA